MELTLDELKDLIQTINDSELREFSINEGDYALHLSKNDAPTVVQSAVAPEVMSDGAGSATSTEPQNDVQPAEVLGSFITAPLVGTAYLRPNPDAKPFVSVGDHVAVGDQVALIEAMKLMTPIKSDVAGTVKRILVSDEDMVDYDMNLIEILPD
ncbi:acetyl-CoA carboxylase biotin carboxyl carrier protein [Weissella minor]|uniref:acetyl-CoA carboxylase biotin carboxyl carrier protein n=1 Tax=Weissella minor TaxID=1620 RepID=UPI001BB0AF08|nr:acetyl-CoA carboxylase biotin carboxyl carrier protein [Weissella minor]MBS0949997.1 acetyl-CoA carboxylase biotin carboxyl carrier protein [Weissella minor]